MRLILVLAAVSLVGCQQSFEESEDGVTAEKRCKRVWVDLQHMADLEDIITPAELKKMCDNFKSQNSGVECERTVKTTDRNGKPVTYKESVTIDSDFDCKLN
jgi:hypothetical protein